jgi:uncharacterized protein YndB with AHSA1/START domain
VSPYRHGAAVIDFPSDLEILVRRDFEAPIELVFEVMTQPEHMRHHIAPYGEEVTVCDMDLRVGGDYHIVFLAPDDGREMSFRGTFLEVEPPTRTVQTWLFDGWPDADAVETMELHETDGVTTLSYRLAFRDQAGRDHMGKFDGLLANFDNVEAHLRSLLDPKRAASG